VHDGRRHAETLIPAIDQLLRFVQRDRTAITHIGVDVGPGLFTGLRVGVATAKGLALALDRPVVTFSSLELLALAAPGSSTSAPHPRVITSVIDARRGEIYAAQFRSDGALLTTVVAPFVASPTVVLAKLGPADVVVGDAASSIGAAAVPGHRCAPSPVTMAHAIAERARAGRLVEHEQRGDDVELLYLRASDAELQRQP
jgi:tRNA threonylcarbamoyladenosine biosynthesis protein TsaB